MAVPDTFLELRRLESLDVSFVSYLLAEVHCMKGEVLDFVAALVVGLGTFSLL
jgi:hypothetical protein